MARERDTTIRSQFRPVIQIQDIHQAQDREEGFTYKNVIMTYKNEPDRVQRYLRAGWEIVETTVSSKDDRSFTPNSKEEKLRPQMRVETTTDGHDQILMRILTSKWEQNQLDKKTGREQALLREAQRRGDKVINRGNEVITTGAELNL